jgi:hypothetical protein
MPQCTPPRTIKKKKEEKHYLKKEKTSINFPVIVPYAQQLRRQRWRGSQFEVKLGLVA